MCARVFVTSLLRSEPDLDIHVFADVKIGFGVVYSQTSADGKLRFEVVLRGCFNHRLAEASTLVDLQSFTS